MFPQSALFREIFRGSAAGRGIAQRGLFHGLQAAFQDTGNCPAHFTSQSVSFPVLQTFFIQHPRQRVPPLPKKRHREASVL